MYLLATVQIHRYEIHLIVQVSTQFLSYQARSPPESIPHRLDDGIEHPDLIRQVELLECHAERRVPACNPLNRCFETQEAPLLHLGGQFTAHAASFHGLVHHDAATSLLDTFDHGLNLMQYYVSARVRDLDFEMAPTS